MTLFPYFLVHLLIVASLILTAIGVIVLLWLIVSDFIRRNIW